MAKKPVFVRTTISVPSDLKRRMDKVTEDVNWSAIATAAFKSQLENSAMSTVVERLQESKKKHCPSYFSGREAGERWVKETAEVPQLERLQYAWDHLIYREGDTRDKKTLSVGEQLADVFGFTKAQRTDEQYVIGFVRAASDLWKTLQTKI